MIKTSETTPFSLAKENRELKEKIERLAKANWNYDIANRKISEELNETRLRLAKAEARIEELTRVSVETVVVDNEESRIPIVVNLEKY